MSHPETYRAYAFLEKGGELKPIEVQWKDPEQGEIVVKVLACGVCASDEMAKYQILPGTAFPRIPGHEIVGDVAAIPPTETVWQIGRRVGAGWHGGHCSTCRRCRQCRFSLCAKKQTNGIARDGGFAEYVTLRTEAIAHVPDDIDPAEAAPLLCAGVTCFTSIRKMNAAPPDLIAVQGMGGVGHLAVQFTKAMGYRTVVLSTSPDKEKLAYELGVDAFIDSSAGVSHAQELKKMGGAQVVICTNPDPNAIESVQLGLTHGGQFMLVAVTERVNMHWGMLVEFQLSLDIGVAGTPIESEECFDFVKTHSIKVMTERFPLGKAQEAYERRSVARFRSVIVPSLGV